MYIGRVVGIGPKNPLFRIVKITEEENSNDDDNLVYSNTKNNHENIIKSKEDNQPEQVERSSLDTQPTSSNDKGELPAKGAVLQTDTESKSAIDPYTVPEILNIPPPPGGNIRTQYCHN